MADDLDQRTQARLEQFEAQLILAKDRTIRESRERILNWLKLVGFFVAVATSIMGFWGYDKYTSLDQYVNETITEIDRLKAELDEAKTEFEAREREFQQLQASIEGRIEELSSKTAEVENLQQKYQDLHEQAGEVARQIAEFKHDSATIARVKNSLYDVYVQLDTAGAGSDESARQAPWRLTEALKDKGFLVPTDNIALVGVDRSEIIYYRRAAESAAQAMKQQIEATAPRLKVNLTFKDRRHENPRLLVAKIKW